MLVNTCGTVDHRVLRVFGVRTNRMRSRSLSKMDPKLKKTDSIGPAGQEQTPLWFCLCAWMCVRVCLWVAGPHFCEKVRSLSHTFDEQIEPQQNSGNVPRRHNITPKHLPRVARLNMRLSPRPQLDLFVSTVNVVTSAFYLLSYLMVWRQWKKLLDFHTHPRWTYRHIHALHRLDSKLLYVSLKQ